MSRIFTMYKTRVGGDPVAVQLLNRLQKNGYHQLTDVKIEIVLRLEKNGIQFPEAEFSRSIFSHPQAEAVTLTSSLDLSQGEIIEISYQRAWTDPELGSILHAAEALQVEGLEWARLSTRYQLVGVSEETVQEIAKRFLFNPSSQTIITAGEVWETLKPQGRYGGVELIDIAAMTPQKLLVLSNQRRLFLSPEQLSTIYKFYSQVGKQARDAELEMLAAAWGDHCNHTTWKALNLLQCLHDATHQIDHPLVISVFVDNSGVIEFYDGQAINAKGETHISPSSVETYGGIMTKHGGVIRDPLFTGQGAWLWAGTTIMGTCDPRMSWENVPEGALHPLTILRESIRGTKDYTNPMGIPMAWSQYMIHPGNVKCFALGHSVGIQPANRAKKGKAKVGDLVVLIGGKTGIDGVHGSTVSSGKMTFETIKIDSTHVQIGMPIEEKKLVEAIPVLRDADCIRACTDCGAAGLSSAVGEMGSETTREEKIVSGVWVNLAWVPLKCSGMNEWEIWLSESQERGVLAIPPDKLQLALTILNDYGVPATVIGIFTDSERCQVINNPDINNEKWIKNPQTILSGTIAVDLPYSFLTQACPLPKIKVAKPKRKSKPFDPGIPHNEIGWIKLVKRLLGHYNLSDQSAAAHQYDQTVQGATVQTYIGGQNENMPDELFVSTPILGKPFAAGIANAVNQFYGPVDPAAFGGLIYAQAITKLVAAGFSPADIACVANVYTPRVTDNPENAWRLVQLVKYGYAPASVDLQVPIISGKDSSSGTFVCKDGTLIDAPLTLDVLAMGRMPDSNRLIPKAFAKPGDALVLFHPGLKRIALGGSVFLDLFDQTGDALPEVDLLELRSGLIRYHEMLKQLEWSKHIHSRSVIEMGGLIRRLFEMSIGSGLGCKINLPDDPLLWLFGELNTAILFATDSPECVQHLSSDFLVLGEVTEEPIIGVSCQSQELFKSSTEELSEKWSKTFAEVVL